MEILATTELQAIFPSFVMHKRHEMPEGYNDALFELAAEDSTANFLVDDGNPKNVGMRNNHLGHIRHNFLVDFKDHPEVQLLMRMVDQSIREYLQMVYKYDHQGDIRMMSDTFWQRGKDFNEDTGIVTHTHRCDLVATYYPRIRLDEDCPDTALHRGAVRFYDPANVGKRMWPCNNSNEWFYGGWFNVEPQEGSLCIFEGHIPHDSAQFVGSERMCIPILCDLELPNEHCKVPVSQLLGG